MDKASLLREVSPPLDGMLAEQILEEFLSLERRFVLRDWEPATLDGGQFAEIGARIIYHQDSGNLNRRKTVNNCLKYVEDELNQNQHGFPDRRSALHSCKVLRTIYKFRSARGAVHIDPEYTANHLDAKLVLENARWFLGEVLRVFWKGNRSAVASAIRQLVTYDVPIVGSFSGDLLVQRTDCSVEEEVLILLHHSGEEGTSRRDLGRFVRRAASSITRAIQSLGSARQVIRLQTGNYRLTDLGARRVLNELADKFS